MKKLLTMAAAIILAATLSAQQPVITFEKTKHDFGKINEADGRVTEVFTFKNEGASPLVLSNVRASCGCTTPKWTQEPVEPGQTGTITVTYNPNGRPGKFNKTITVKSNATEPEKKLYITGEVIPKTATPVDNYPVKLGLLSLKAGELRMGNIMADTSDIQTIEFANQSKDTFTLAFESKVNYIYASGSKEQSEITVLPGTKGSVHVWLIAEASRTYGPVESAIYAVINGKKDETPITITANIQENFSRMTEQQKADAPFAEVNKDVNLGTFTMNKKGTRVFHITNLGINPLMVRRLVADTQNMNVAAPKKVASGKKGAVKVTILPTEAGNYSSELIIITNDPKQPVHTVTLHWSVEK